MLNNNARTSGSIAPERMIARAERASFLVDLAA